MADRILTTHTGSLPRPDDLLQMMWARIDGEEVDEAKLSERIDSAVAEVVAKQRESGVDVVSDGEYSKSGFVSYVTERFSGFGGTSAFSTADLEEFPDLAHKLFDRPHIHHAKIGNCVGPVELTDRDAVQRDIDRFKGALDGTDPSRAFLGTVSPGEIAFAYPDQHYGSPEKYMEALAEALRHEYKAITDAGLKLQVDSPDMAMAAHARMSGGELFDFENHLPLAAEALNAALEGIPAEQVRVHICWGNYAGPHHMDIPLESVIDQIYRVNAGSISIEGANPRHAHEWRVFEDHALPDDKKVILGVIDVRTNCIEHPRVVADRLVQLGKIIGKERLLAGTDCGMDTLSGQELVDPEVSWRKLQAMADGAELASKEL